MFGQMIEGELSVVNESLNVSKKRNHLYRKFVAAEHGVLGHCVCIRIHECIIAFICSLVPSPDSRYTGHRDVNEDGNENNQTMNLLRMRLLTPTHLE